MCDNHHSSSIAFFDSLALEWDSFHDLKTLSAQFDSELTNFDIRSDEHILDVGCGTSLNELVLNIPIVFPFFEKYSGQKKLIYIIILIISGEH